MDSVMIENKVIALKELQKIVDDAKAKSKRVVWTNGCYDLLHAGHVRYLLKARACGDILVVGLNSDASVRMSKGPGRPIVKEQERALVMSALSCVDYVIIFDDKSPLKMIDCLRPDVYAKGGDYTIDTINQEERRLVEGYGGEIALLPGVEGRSTTDLIEKILRVYETKSCQESKSV
jgi:D-beta-D-heptose 7-phosphate kinase / D-beta-D-heptose 1-phosphate adenosyltransferase